MLGAQNPILKFIIGHGMSCPLKHLLHILIVLVPMSNLYPPLKLSFYVLESGAASEPAVHGGRRGANPRSQMRRRLPQH